MLRGYRLFVAAVVVLAPASAMGHVLMTSPPPRNDRDDLKPPTYPGPCGNVPRTKKFTQYKVGETIQVKFTETVAHTGCFQIGFSQANDQNFRVLAQMVDPAGGKDASYTMNVKLPDGVSCEACTLQLRQQMSGTAQCPADAAEPPIQSTYYSCADIRIGDFPDAAPSEEEEDAGGGGGGGGGGGSDDGDGGKTGASSSGGARRLTPVNSDDGGCAVGWGGATGFSLVGSVGLGLVALARRRRRR